MNASEKESAYDDDAIEIPIDGTLDLHHFRPEEVADLVTHYVHECKEMKIASLRLIHGKGTGTLRENVHSSLKKIKFVESFCLADQSGGGWGATLVTLKI